jgi:hypothetical protein
MHHHNHALHALDRASRTSGGNLTMHILLTLFTGGLWLPVLIAVACRDGKRQRYIHRNQAPAYYPQGYPLQYGQPGYQYPQQYPPQPGYGYPQPYQGPYRQIGR